MDAKAVLFFPRISGCRFGHECACSLQWLFLPMVGRDGTLDERGMEQIRMNIWELRWEKARERWAGLSSLEAPGVWEFGN